MSDERVLMSPNNAEIVIAAPLYRNLDFVVSENCSIKLTTSSLKPLAYLIDCGEFANVLSADWVEKNLIDLGEL